MPALMRCHDASTDELQQRTPLPLPNDAFTHIVHSRRRAPLLQSNQPPQVPDTPTPPSIRATPPPDSRGRPSRWPHGFAALLATCPCRLVPSSRSKAKLRLPPPTTLLTLPPLCRGGGGEVLAAWSMVGGRRLREAKPHDAAPPLLLQLLQAARWLSPATLTA
jgi:hypothetical protein